MRLAKYARKTDRELQGPFKRKILVLPDLGK